MGDEGHRASLGHQDLLDIHGNEYQDGHQSEAMIFIHGIR